jgi:hypothetical protein
MRVPLAVVVFPILASMSPPARDAAAATPARGPAPSRRVAAAAAGVPRAAREFQVDRAGHVLWVDSFGRIRRDGADTGWQPASDRREFVVDATDNVLFVDSFGTLHRNDETFNAKPEHGAFGHDRRGTLYWIDWFQQHLFREGEDLGYEASWQSPIRGDTHGNIYYVNPGTRTLWRNGQDTRAHFLGLDYHVTDDGKVYYWTYHNPSSSIVWVLDANTGRATFYDWGARFPFLELDRQGRPWYVGMGGRVMREKQPMYGLTYFGDFQLDDAANVYTVRDREVHRNGQPTGFATTGAFGVSGEGDVFALVDETWGRMEKNGVPLDFSL